jgi:23S rRNA (adenine2030-N6)-methyltransferase
LLSYQHIYHAGNHADVIKHLTLLSVLDKLQQKSKPFTLIDTHAGAGMYRLSDEKAQKNAEYQSGIGLLAGSTLEQHGSPLLQQYWDGVSDAYAQQQYLGSAGWMQNYLRTGDHGHFCELHPAVFPDLSAYLSKANAHAYQQDGFKQLIALLPPLAKRGVVLIDPPYEQVSEYNECVTTLEQSLKRWATGCYLLWYPLITTENSAKQAASGRMIRDLQVLSAKDSVSNMAQIEWLIDTPEHYQGMYGSGIIAINLPWGCADAIQAACTALLTEVTQSGGPLPRANFTLNWLKAPQ